MPIELIAFAGVVLMIVILFIWGCIRINTLKADFERDLLRIRRH